MWWKNTKHRRKETGSQILSDSYQQLPNQRGVCVCVKSSGEGQNVNVTENGDGVGDECERVNGVSGCGWRVEVNTLNRSYSLFQDQAAALDETTCFIKSLITHTHTHTRTHTVSVRKLLSNRQTGHRRWGWSDKGGRLYNRCLWLLHNQHVHKNLTSRTHTHTQSCTTSHTLSRVRRSQRIRWQFKNI